MSLATRLAAIEQRRLGRQIEPLPPGPISITGLDGATVVIACFDPVQPRMSGGLPDLLNRAIWRDSATCPDAHDCRYADACRADGSSPADKKVAKPD